MKNIKVAAINETTLELLEKAEAGDRIDLKSITQIDTSIILQKINEQRDQVYKMKIEEYENSHKKDIDNAILRTKENFINEKSQLMQEITELKTKNAELENSVKLSVEKEYLSKINNLNEEIIKIKSLLNEEKTQSQLELTKALNSQKDEFTEILQEKERQIDKLTLSNTALNTKSLGGQLEVWCDKKMLIAKQNAFEECTWEKDNTAVKNDDNEKRTKADFIFKIYKNESHNPDEILTSVCLEMKNEFFGSENKKKNSDHYAKLDQDRAKKECEYALLVSELEWDVKDDLPFFKVPGYEKMYLVRPQYFVEFLTIIESFALKTQDLKDQLNKKKVEFEETDKIIKEFDDFKDSLLNNQLERIQVGIQKVKDESQKIANCLGVINTTCDTITLKYINETINKLNKFSIEKLTKKIEQL